jgi:pimeloyl-ACP methyl ester carboxylesterase
MDAPDACRNTLPLMPRIQLDGADLHYQDTGGTGEPVVFAHGLLWSTKLFQFQLDALRGEHRCIAFDFRGQGQSEVTRSGYDMDTLTRDAAQIIEKLGAAPCHFVGLSMGGFVGMRLASRTPGLLRSLALLETAADPEPLLNRPRYAAMAAMARVLGFGPFVPQVEKIMFGKSFLADPSREAIRRDLRAQLLGNDRTGTPRAVSGVIWRKGIQDLLSRIDVPTLVLSGEEDVAVTPARSRRTAEAIRGARFQTIPRAGHSSSLENPDAVTEALRAFFADVRGRARAQASSAS